MSVDQRMVTYIHKPWLVTPSTSCLSAAVIHVRWLSKLAKITAKPSDKPCLIRPYPHHSPPCAHPPLRLLRPLRTSPPHTPRPRKTFRLTAPASKDVSASLALIRPPPLARRRPRQRRRLPTLPPPPPHRLPDPLPPPARRHHRPRPRLHRFPILHSGKGQDPVPADRERAAVDAEGLQDLEREPVRERGRLSETEAGVGEGRGGAGECVLLC